MTPEPVQALQQHVAGALQHIYKMVGLNKPNDLRNTISALHRALTGEGIDPPSSVNRGLMWDAYFSIPENCKKPLSQIAEEMGCSKSTARYAATQRRVPLQANNVERMAARTLANPVAVKRAPRPNRRKPKPQPGKPQPANSSGTGTGPCGPVLCRQGTHPPAGLVCDQGSQRPVV